MGLTTDSNIFIITLYFGTFPLLFIHSLSIEGIMNV